MNITIPTVAAVSVAPVLAQAEETGRGFERSTPNDVNDLHFQPAEVGLDRAVCGGFGDDASEQRIDLSVGRNWSQLSQVQIDQQANAITGVAAAVYCGCDTNKPGRQAPRDE